MDKAYLRQCNDGEHFELSFEYKQTNPAVKRVFNFSRKLSEDINALLNRVSINVEKALSKKAKKKKSEGELSKGVIIKLSQNNMEVSRDSICGDVFLSGTELILFINDCQYSVIVNSPWVSCLELPNSILANFPVYPTKFESYYTDKDVSEFIWYKSADKTHWEQVVCIPKNQNANGPTVECETSCTVEASPGECPFERRHNFCKERAQGTEFRVMSYNLLADLYCDSNYSRTVLFPYCPPYALNINYRKQLLLKEIIGYNSDLICLQEVDRRVYKNDLQPILSHYNYNSTFYLKGGEVAEGLAFFYNKSRFILLDSDQLVFSQKIDTEPVFAEIWNKINTNSKLAERIKARTTTLQLNVVGSLDNDEILLIANTHLYFHPDADHIRLLHGCMAIKYLEQYSNQLKERYCGKRVSLIFCGDFNSVPDCGIYKLYTTGSIPGDYIDYSSNKSEHIENINIHHSFKLDSACGTPKYTNFTELFAACLDYIFYEKSSLGVSQIIPLPSDEELKENTAIPSVVFPSDHVALISDLRWL
ncbi:hypothetical protein GWI33_008531 [Rhynchophorus ferrugineus]|uniref:2',5'-phosphodiesterase 12 n=1 Tax=Rhynchophorus ferrugineus TaxID=354439 RepID=A0A834IGK2_RHYFE|nr:hypothetical protein GWI33_008531 [Rhynchophorus ferrugineus]